MKEYSIIKKLINIPIIDIVIITLGAILINQFYLGLYLGWFTAEGYNAQVLSFVQETNSPQAWKQMLKWTASHAKLFAPLLGGFLFLLGVSLVLLLFRSIMTLIASLFFFIMWMTQWNYPASWIFELLFPALFGLYAALASFPRNKNIYSFLLGPSFFGKLKLHWRVIVILLSSSWLCYAIILSKNGFAANSYIAWFTTITFGLAFFFSSIVDYYRFKTNIEYLLRKIPWADIMVITIGAMLIMQVYADLEVNWFAPEGYKQLITVYATSTAAPNWFKVFLYWSAQHSHFLVYIQAIFEFTAAFLLSMLVLRAPMLVLTTGLLFILMYAEFGVSARWPAHPQDPRTWVWELMFVVIIAIFLSLKICARDLTSKSLRTIILGPNLYGLLHFGWRMVIIIIASILLYAAGIAAHVFGTQYHQIALLAGISFFIALFIGVCLDYWRKKSTHSSEASNCHNYTKRCNIHDRK